MQLIDTHTHLYLKEFDKDRHEMIRRAVKSGVKKMLLPNIEADSVQDMLELSETFPGICLPMIGLHPGSVNKDFEKQLKLIENLPGRERFVAIGETGIDLYWDKTFKEQQKDAFMIQVQWAKKWALPIVIHARESFNEIFNILDKQMDERLKGVFHSFTGNSDHIRVISEYGFYFGINGIVTYKNSDVATIVNRIPLEKLLLETDSPYLTPVPNRGKRNESANLVYIAQHLAEILKLKTEDLASITSENAERLFKLNRHDG